MKPKWCIAPWKKRLSWWNTKK